MALRESMKRLFRMVFCGALVAALGSCTQVTTLVLINASDHGMEVRYELDWPLAPGSDNQPMIASLEAYDGRSTDWRPLGVGEALRIGAGERSVTLVLPAESVLRFGSETFQETTGGGIRVSIQVLELRTATGSRRYEGTEVADGFQQQSGFLWELRYP